MSSPTISVCISTRRYGGLITQIKHFLNQTYQDFELVLVDTLYEIRKDEIAELAKTCWFPITHIPPKFNLRPVGIDHASMRNSALLHAKGKYVIFFDDYQIPDPNFVRGHAEVLEKGFCSVGQQIYIMPTDFDGDYKIDIKRQDSRGTQPALVQYTSWWTNSAGASLDLLLKVNGYDERSDGGDGGEDYQLAYRLSLMGAKFAYNPKSLCYHMEHTHIKIYPHAPATCSWIQYAGSKEKWLEMFPYNKHQVDMIDWANISKYSGENHAKSMFVRNQYNQLGDPTLVETPTMTTWFDEDVKFYKCKICGLEGITDSLMLFNSICKHRKFQAPKKYFDLVKERIKLENE